MITIGSIKEDKQSICNALLPVLQMTTNLFDLVDLNYNEDHDLVIATFDGGYVRYANVQMDSGTAMIVDIVKQIV